VTAADAPRAGQREWIALAVIALPCLLYSMDATVLYLPVPSLTADLEPSSSELLWITDVYGFLLAGFLITMGMFGELTYHGTVNSGSRSVGSLEDATEPTSTHAKKEEP
jgi:hypothetical protein